VLSGGVGRNLCIKEALSKKAGLPVYTHSHPEIAGALGAALEAQNSQE
jgi:activator of 2-hydroxyglutaryl-CoA dehydratase